MYIFVFCFRSFVCSFSSFDTVCLFLPFAFFSCCLFVLILIENYRKIQKQRDVILPSIRKKRLLDKLGNLLQFYVEIVVFIRNQVCVHSLPLKMNIFRYFDLARNMSEKYSFECLKFYTSWFFYVKLQLDILLTLLLQVYFLTCFKKIIFEKTFSFLKIITFDMYTFFVKIL